ncbi:hypothetical protein ATHL_03610, partial [Anaerolinea thermolimosa]
MWIDLPLPLQGWNFTGRVKTALHPVFTCEGPKITCPELHR